MSGTNDEQGLEIISNDECIQVGYWDTKMSGGWLHKTGHAHTIYESETGASTPVSQETVLDMFVLDRFLNKGIVLEEDHC